MEMSLNRKPITCFEVERILGISNDGSYQVQWAPAWVSKFHLVGCEHLIQEFLQQQAEKVAEMQSQSVAIELDSGNVLSEHHFTGIVNKNCSHRPVPGKTESDELQGQQAIHEPACNYDDDYSDAGCPKPSDEPTCSFDSSTIDSIKKEAEIAVLNNIDSSIKVEVDSPVNVTEIPCSSKSCTEDGGSLILSAEVSQEPTTGEELDDSEDYEEIFQSQKNYSRKHVCSICKQQFLSEFTLQEHSLVHRVDKSVSPNPIIHKYSKEYLCEYCGKQFYRKDSLNKHLRTHTGEKPFQCSYCSKSFAESGNLTKHKRIHTGERPYKCEICSETFTYKHHLNSHKLKHDSTQRT